jgi:Zn-finger nucleic acid-binding protein
MNCPKCGAPMREREKEDIVIDICPNCRGIFLDAGELEKLTAVEDRYYRSRGYRDEDDDDDDRGRSGDSRGERGYTGDPRDARRPADYQQGYAPPRKRKGGFLSNMFESFGGGEGADD